MMNTESDEACTGADLKLRGSQPGVKRGCACRRCSPSCSATPLFYQEFNIEVYKDYFVNTMANDTALIDGTYALMVPEPHGPEVQVMDTTKFFQIPMPKAYISLTQDFTLSSDYKSWLLFSDRVKKGNNAGVPYQVTHFCYLCACQNSQQGSPTPKVEQAIVLGTSMMFS